MGFMNTVKVSQSLLREAKKFLPLLSILIVRFYKNSVQEVRGESLVFMKIDLSKAVLFL